MSLRQFATSFLQCERSERPSAAKRLSIKSASCEKGRGASGLCDGESIQIATSRELDMNQTAKMKLLSSLTLAATAFVAAPALAGSHGNGSAGSGQARHGNGADIPQFKIETDAKQLCKGDTVVWGSSNQPNTFFVEGAGPPRVGGFYTCISLARQAGYRIVGN